MRFSPATPPLPQSVREAGRSLAPLSAPGGVASLALRGTRRARIGQFDLSPKARPLTIRVEQDRNSIVLRAGGELDIASRAFGHRVPGATGLLEEFLNPTTFLRGTFAALEVGLTDNPASLFEESLRLIHIYHLPGDRADHESWASRISTLAALGFQTFATFEYFDPVRPVQVSRPLEPSYSSPPSNLGTIGSLCLLQIVKCWRTSPPDKFPGVCERPSGGR